MSRRWKVVHWLTWSSFVGLALCHLVGKAIYESPKEQMASPVGGSQVWAFSGMWILGLLVLMPISVWLRCARFLADGIDLQK
jgi:hypothetical protein